MSWNVLYIVDLLAITLFAVSYYRNCYRRGYRIDFWYASLFLSCVFPNMLMLPFAKSELNMIVVGRDMGGILEALPTVFLITMLGYLSVLAGGGLWRLQVGIGLRDATVRALDMLPRCSMMVMSSRAVLVFQSALCLLAQCLFLTMYFSQSGFGFNVRDYTFANPTLRPVALIISNYSIVVASHCLARYVDTKERILLACTLLLTLGLVFFGARSNFLGIYLTVLLCYFVWLRDKISLFRVVSLIVVIISGGIYLGNVRGGEYSLAGFFGSLAFLLLYGNNFSDLRDFAWVYVWWDHVFWAGKTYLAALAAFVPRFASQFRDTWGLGVATASTVGFDPQVHPGLRPGIFGEGFFNFGLFGVIAVGLVVGIVLRRADMEVKSAFASSRPSMMKAFASTASLALSGLLTLSNSSSAFYVLLGVYFTSWSFLCIERMFRRPAVLRSSTG